MSFTNPKDHLYGTVRDSTNPNPFGCLDCLTKDDFEAQVFPLYLYSGTYLCANHVRLRRESFLIEADANIVSAQDFIDDQNDANALREEEKRKK